MQVSHGDHQNALVDLVSAWEWQLRWLPYHKLLKRPFSVDPAGFAEVLKGRTVLPAHPGVLCSEIHHPPRQHS